MLIKFGKCGEICGGLKKGGVSHTTPPSQCIKSVSWGPFTWVDWNLGE